MKPHSGALFGTREGIQQFRLLSGAVYDYNFVGVSGRGKFLGYLWMPEGSPSWLVMEEELRDGGTVTRCLNPAQMYSLTPVVKEDKG